MKSVIKKDRVSVGGSDAVRRTRDVGAEPPRPHAPAPGVRLVRVDGRVHALEVTCRCGEVSVVELDYADAPASPPGTEPSPERSR